MSLPILYSFRRCPYAIRARLGLYYAETSIELREILLKDKPEHMVNISPKSTVPVLQLENGDVIDESLDIALWALSNNDPLGLLVKGFKYQSKTSVLIEQNDTQFKHYLDRYKYADRFPENSMEFYRTEGLAFIQSLDDRLMKSTYLNGHLISLDDIAIVPFVRQFAHVDLNWFKGAGCENALRWMMSILESPAFIYIMTKYSLWKPGTAGERFGFNHV